MRRCEVDGSPNRSGPSDCETPAGPCPRGTSWSWPPYWPSDCPGPLGPSSAPARRPSPTLVPRPPPAHPSSNPAARRLRRELLNRHPARVSPPASLRPALFSHPKAHLVSPASRQAWSSYTSLARSAAPVWSVLRSARASPTYSPSPAARSPGVDLTTLNLARQVIDGEQIIVGQPAAPQPTTAPGATTSTAPTAPTDAPVNLNTATLDQLDVLPGVGPVLAQRILDYRSQNGPFTTIDQLQEVPGVGPKKFDSLKPHVRI